jgi:hypothetical protein
MKNVKEFNKGISMIEEGLELIKNSVGEDTAKEVASKVAKGVSGEAGDRREELEAMKYNDLKALCSKLGIKAVGKAPQLVELILEAEANGADGEEAPKSGKGGAKASSADSAEEDGADTDGAEEDGEELDADEMKEQLGELELDDLKEIAKTADVLVKKGAKKADIIKVLVANLEATDSALQELGYYDEEGEEDTEEDNSDDEEASLADTLAEQEVEDLAEICSEYGLSSKGKKQALIDRILEAVEKGDINEEDLFGEGEEDTEEDSNEEEGEWYSEEELQEMSVKELEELAEENEIEIPKKKVKGKSVTDKDALVEALVALGEEAGEDGEEEGEGYSQEELEEMETKDLVSLAEENEIEVPKKKVKGKSVTDRDALIEAILNF